MSIAEKQATISENNVVIAENMQKVYEAGQDSMVDPDKIIPKSTSGNPVYLDDVSEIPHDVGITLTSDSITDFSDVNVTVCGKNLLPESKYKKTINTKGITITYEGNGIFHIVGTIDATENSVYLDSAMFFNNEFIRIEKEKTYTLSTKIISGSYSGITTPLISYLGLGSQTISGIKNWLAVRIQNTDEVGTKRYEKATPSSVLVDATHLKRFWIYQIIGKGNIATYDIRIQVWLEEGSLSTDYESYKGTTYTANADGTVEGVKSLSPYMNIYSDADVDIKVDYHKSYGMQTEWDRFWDSIQCKGLRTNYQSAFGIPATIRNETFMPWNDEMFSPKYDLKPTNAYRMFQSTGIKNFKRCLAKNNVVFDTSNCKTESSVSMMFYQNFILELPEINLSNVAGRLVETIRECAELKKVDKVILASDGSQTFTNTFLNNTSLTDITFEGVIGSTISFRDSPLTPESMKSIISCLKDYSAESTDVYTLTFKEDCWTALEADSTAPDGGTWKDYVRNLGWLV